MTIRTADGLSANLDEAHWQTHIISSHPELNGSWERVVETLQQPAAVFRSKRDQKTRIYVRYYNGITISGVVIDLLPLLVYVREDDGFVVTAHFAGAMMRRMGEQIWPS